MDALTGAHSGAMLQQAKAYTDLTAVAELRGASSDDEGQLRALAGQFESLFIGMALKSMRNANEYFSQDSPFSSQQAQIYRDMFDNQISLTLAQGRGIGLADHIVRQLKQYLPQQAQEPSQIDLKL